MTVESAVLTAPLVLPRQAGPVDPPLAPLPSERVRQPGHGTAATEAERAFGLGLVGLFLGLETIIVGGLLLAQHAPTP